MANEVGFDTPRRGMDYILARLKEPSTYKGLLALGAAFGLQVDAQQSAAVVSALLALIGVWEVFRREKK
jgi:hypothetical protein